MKYLPFTVDAALLRELGERLVGRPQIALGELIKNSYDADASRVVVSFEADRITIFDNGDGMSFAEFRDYWMRVGSTHKARMSTTQRFKRPITGSKGVGRLAAQFLADRLSLRTVSNKSSNELLVSVDWTKAVLAGDLQKAKAGYVEGKLSGTFPGDSPHGTAIILEGLRHDWTNDAFRSLAQEVWNLQPPFIGTGPRDFAIELTHLGSSEATRIFATQMTAILELWDAKLTGRLDTKRQTRWSCSFSTVMERKLACDIRSTVACFKALHLDSGI